MTLEERLSKLERQNRNLRIACAAVLFLVAGGLTAGAAYQAAPQPGPVVATEFVLKDTDGNTRGKWLVEGNKTQLLLRSPATTQLVDLAVGSNFDARGIGSYVRVDASAGRRNPAMVSFEVSQADDEPLYFLGWQPQERRNPDGSAYRPN